MNAVVTGAGSGVGQATAIALARLGWRVAITGRRAETLAETVKLAGAASGQVLSVVCDVGDPAAVEQMRDRVLKEFGEVDALINAAGTNAPKRALEILSPADYKLIMDANLNGAYYAVQAFLPGMRQRKTGTIVNVVSEAGKQASPKAGPAYVMSKFGMAGLTQAINAEERGNGVRACSIFPGDINTPLLERRPNPPPADARLKMLRPEDVAECILLALRLPPHAILEEVLLRPR